MPQARKGSKQKDLDGDPGKKKKESSRTVIGTTGATGEKSPVHERRGTVPPAPDFLDEVATTEWYTIGEELEKYDLLSAMDLTALAIYCQAKSEYIKATVDIQTNGSVMVMESGYEQQRPSVIIQQRSAGIIRQFLYEFGLSPRARAQLDIKESRSDCPKCGMPVDVCGCANSLKAVK